MNEIMFELKNERIKEIYNEKNEFIFVQRNEEKSEGDLICVTDMNVPLVCPIYIFRELTNLSNEKIYEQAKEILSKQDFDERFYSDEKISEQLRIARNIKILLEKEELRTFKKEQIKIIAEKIDEAKRLKIERNFEELNKTSSLYKKSHQSYSDNYVTIYDLETLEELEDLKENTEFEEEFGSEYTKHGGDYMLNRNKTYLFIEDEEVGNEDRSYGWMVNHYKEYTLYIPKECIFSSIDEDIIEIIKKFNL